MAAALDPDGPAPHRGPGRPAVRGRVLTGDLGVPLVVGAAVLAGVIYLGVTDPHRPGGHLVCPLLTFTGYLCPGCGAQRAVHDLTRLDLAGAWSMNALVVLAAPPALVGWLGWLRRRWRGGAGGGRSPACRGATALPAASRMASAARVAAPWLLLTVVLAFGVLRNVPALASALAPG